MEVIGDCPAHDELASDLERWINEFRSAAADCSGGKVWVEKVQLHTSLPLVTKSAIPAGGPVGELVSYLEGLPGDPSQLALLMGSLEDLLKKLPRELREGSGAIPLANTNWLADILVQIRPMLLRRLLKGGDFK